MLRLPPGDTMPNSRLPVLIYTQAFKGGAPELDRLLPANGWGGVWHNGIYDFDHFHSNAHEVLGIARGTATVRLGGPVGETVTVQAGDVLVLPAGTGHRLVESRGDLVVVGAYPPGQERYDICRERSPEAELRIRRVRLPLTDPVRGPDGPLVRLWV
ncbi:MAG TPA: cupin domain-containing protein [Devosia sp.]|nr:cupin domain-containing protein [Devosia sp.]